MNTAVLYARFSPGARLNCKSAEAQLEQGRKCCKFHDCEIIGEFADDNAASNPDQYFFFPDSDSPFQNCEELAIALGYEEDWGGDTASNSVCQPDVSACQQVTTSVTSGDCDNCGV